MLPRFSMLLEPEKAHFWGWACGPKLEARALRVDHFFGPAPDDELQTRWKRSIPAAFGTGTAHARSRGC